MTFRVFSKKHNLYTNSPLWPSNQRTWSEWCIYPSGEICELIFADDVMSCEAQIHDKRNFEVEPWTGFFDSKGRKIYLGDVIRLDCFSLDYEVIWQFDRFMIKALYELGEGDDGIYPIRSSLDLSLNWSVVGNIHGVEYND